MSTIAAVGTALPEHILRQSDARNFVHALFGDAFNGEIERLLPIFDNSEIEERHFCMTEEWFAGNRTFREKNDLYIQHGLELSEQAISRCLEATGLGYEDFDYLIFVSTTGLSTPSIDARLIERLPFRKDIKRLPLWGLGCAGGASAISRAMDITQAHPAATTLIVVLELCGLTFMRNDLSKSALIATSLFADGCAAVVVEGDEVPRRSSRRLPRVIASQTTSMPDSLRVMGWDIDGEGFHVLISRDIPTIVQTFMRESIECFLQRQHLDIADITHYVAHPGGAKVLTAYEESLGLAPDKLRHTREVLRTCGNMSACSVLFVLDRFMRELGEPESDARSEYGLLGALGPGFSAELVLLQWGEA
jgi:alkylresorcinol/alkylpyrone synthase